jgi:hypothetical protein
MTIFRRPETEAELASLDALRAVAGGKETAIERHGLRVYWIMELLAEKVGDDLDPEILLCAALLHDAGLFVAPRAGRFYLHNGRLFAERVLAPYEWAPRRMLRCLDAIELHHRLTDQSDKGVEVELLRRADLIDATNGFVTDGADRNQLRPVLDGLPRAGLVRQLASRPLRGLPGHAGALAAIVIYAVRRVD